MTPAIEVKELTKSYDGFIAVDHISFNTQKGEVFGFLGPNGAGKTTTIRMLTGISKPTHGEARILGLDVKSDIVQIKRRIGIVPEISNLYDELTALENLIFMAQLYGVPRSERKTRALELLDTFRLSEQRDKLFRKFSRGMKRALTIASALIHKPEVLFLDEPTVGLDVVAARSLRNLIANLRNQGISIFLTTHYLEEADLLCERIAILVKGKILMIDTPDNLKKSIERESIIEFWFDKDITDFARNLDFSSPEIKVVILDSYRFRVYGGKPSRIYEFVFQSAQKHKIGIESVNSIKPSLEDAFVQITGLSPTVMAIEKGGKQNAA